MWLGSELCGVSGGCCDCVFFFFKQKTAYEMRISDWSSDVCSSDLPVTGNAARIDKAADIGEGIGERHPLTPSLFHICKSAAAISLSPSPSPSLAAPWSRIRWMPPAGSVWRGGHELEAPPRDHTSGCIGDETATSTRPQIGRAHV